MYLSWLSFENSSHFLPFDLHWLCFGKLKFKVIHACHVYGIFINFKWEFWSISMLLGLDLTKWFSNHGILQVFKCFPEFWPKKMSFKVLNSSFGAWRWIWKFQNSTSSPERHILCSSGHLCFCISARATKS